MPGPDETRRGPAPYVLQRPLQAQAGPARVGPVWGGLAPVLARDPARVAPESAPSSFAVAPAGEPGQRLEVKGVVYAADGRTPVARVSIYVYQTDVLGPRS